MPEPTPVPISSDPSASCQSFIDDLKSRYRWQEVSAPKIWKPKEVGAELVGFFGGTTMREGHFGQYHVAMIHVPLDGTYMVSGTQIIQKLDAGCIPQGHPVIITWQGYKELSGDRKMKLFDVLVAQGEAVPVEAFPETH